MRDTGKFELLVMLAVAGSALLGAPVYVVLVGAILLFASTLHEYAYLQPRFARTGATRLMASSLMVAAVASLAFASLCFSIGRFFAWLTAL